MTKFLVRACALVILLSPIGLLSAPVASAADTCQGVPVTVSGNHGTPGDDVMVIDTARGSEGSSGSGDDLVCLRATYIGEPLWLAVDTGPGNDRVFNEAVGPNIRVTLGTGADTYAGNDGGTETVVTGTSTWPGNWGLEATGDDDADTVTMGDGYNGVLSAGATPGGPNPDAISMGQGTQSSDVDGLDWSGRATGPRVDMGDGYNSVSVRPGWSGDVVIDAPASNASAGSLELLAWTGTVRSFAWQLDSASVRFIGGAGPESVRAQRVPRPGAHRPRTDIAAGDGDDFVTWPALPGSVDGGTGTDEINIDAAECQQVDLDMARTLTCQPVTGTPSTTSFSAWEEVAVEGALEARVTGTSGADRIRVVAQQAVVQGRGGDDWIAYGDSEASGPLTARLHGGPGHDHVLVSATGDIVATGGHGDDRLRGGLGKDRLLGGRGDDVVVGRSGHDLLAGGAGRDVIRGARGRDLMKGQRGADRLFGGTGRDTARGGPGRDTCRAERRRGCER